MTNWLRFGKQGDPFAMKVGDRIFLGKFYEYCDDCFDTGIWWLVLAMEGTKVLLLTQYALSAEAYNEKGGPTTWKSSSIRKWLNGYFYEEAFDDKEKECIIKTHLTAERNPSYNVDPGPDTDDKVFLLSVSEAKKYILESSERSYDSLHCIATPHAVNSGIYPIRDWNIGVDLCFWWLRSPGSNDSYAADVRSDGTIREEGFRVSTTKNGVRPALWLDLGPWMEECERKISPTIRTSKNLLNVIWKEADERVAKTVIFLYLNVNNDLIPVGQYECNKGTFFKSVSDLVEGDYSLKVVQFDDKEKIICATGIMNLKI